MRMSEAPVSELPPEVAAEMHSAAEAVDRHLAAYVGGLDAPSALREAVEYALLGGGKRVRPVLAWFSCKAMGAPGERALAAAGAVELIHAFSLVHDDLPAMDDDDLRRGRPTLHIRFGEAMAVLAGDFMLALAFDLLHRPPPVGPPHQLGARLARELSRATGEMISGQVRDTIPETDPALTGLERVVTIHRGKTGALIRAACRMGAMCGLPAGAPEDEPRLEAITTYAQSVGLMFQIVDDLIDVEHAPEHTGKRTRKDAPAGKLTFPGLVGVQASREEIERLRSAGVQALRRVGEPARALESVARYLASRTR